ncbi:hypothetical protein AX14_007306 [Amanita brunnescens Koide BX004]|nr:hypothetical protein AX14_007306 [Amanita brunnescens Koide BX004]
MPKTDRIPLTCFSNGPAQVYQNLYPSLNGSSQPLPAPTHLSLPLLTSPLACPLSRRIQFDNSALNTFIDHHSATLCALAFRAEPILSLVRSAGAGTQRREFFLPKVVTDGKHIYDCCI